MTTTMKALRQAFAPEIGPFYEGVPDATSTAGVLIDLTSPVRSDLDQADLYEGHYLMWPIGTAANKLRIVKTYDPTNGYLTPDNPWSTKVLTNYELHGVFDPVGVVPGLLNEALKHMYFETEISFTPANASYTRHNLTTGAPWLTRPEWVYQCGALPTGYTDRMIYTPTIEYGRVYRDGATVYLEAGPFQTTDTVYLKVSKPWYNHVNAGAQNGLILDADTVGNDDPEFVEWAVAWALMAGWRKYRKTMSGQANAEVTRSQIDAAQWASWLTYKLWKPPKRTLFVTNNFGPVNRGSRF